MKTKSIARAGLLCAVYGMFVELDVLSGLLAESVFPYLFALPILVCAMKEEKKISLCALFAMGFLTFVLSGMTTWLIALSMLMAGWSLGYGLYLRHSIIHAALVTFVLLFISSMLQITVLAELFGFDPASQQELYHWLAPLISWQGLLVLTAAFEALLETITIVLMALVIALKVVGASAIKPFAPMGHVHPACAWIFTGAMMVWFFMILFAGQVESWIKDALLFVVLSSLIGLIWNGCMILQRKAVQKGSRIYAVLTVWLAFIPGLNLIEAVIGYTDLIRRSFHSMRNHHETIL
ncbi:MAG: hypothetical protein ACI32F_05640 [Allobaculum sp.]